MKASTRVARTHKLWYYSSDTILLVNVVQYLTEDLRDSGLKTWDGSDTWKPNLISRQLRSFVFKYYIYWNAVRAQNVSPLKA